MARSKITLTCKKCNKEFTHIHFSSNRKQADGYEEWAAENITICPDCWNEERKEAENREISDLSENLPELSGSEKQVAWAMKIRAGFYKKYVDVLDILTEEQKESSVEEINTMEKLFQNDRSTFWIDNRNKNISELVQIIRKEDK